MAVGLITKHVKKAPTAVIDVGPGVGTYGRRLRPQFPDAAFVGVEKWAPHVTNFDLEGQYDRLVISDCAWANWDRIMQFPGDLLVVFGDVLQRLKREDALFSWNQARKYARWTVLTLPIAPQVLHEGQFGNPYEQQLTHWTHPTVLESFPGIIDFETSPIVGAYIAGNE